MQNLSGLVFKVKCGFNDGSEAEVWEEFAERASKYVRTAAADGGCRKSAISQECGRTEEDSCGGLLHSKVFSGCAYMRYEIHPKGLVL